jgi:CRISPR system Cascade subunit CasD
VTSVLLRLEGPLQSWGTRSRFPQRDTEREPSKSGVLGLVCAALGVPRDDDAMLSRLAQARIGVRVDREGSIVSDYHTAGGGRFAGEEYGVFGAKGTVVTQRVYLSGASFLVAIGFDDDSLAAAVDHALGAPRWPLFLGRRACPPALPVRSGVSGREIEAALRAAAWPGKSPPRDPVRLLLECDADAPGAEPRQDQPLSFRLHARSFARRFVRLAWLQPEDVRPMANDEPGLSLVAAEPAQLRVPRPAL